MSGCDLYDDVIATPPDKGSNNSGYYNLIGVLTHQGRSSSSGHYVGWTRDKFGNWLKVDGFVK